MTMGSVTFGSGVAGVMVNGPVPGMAKLMISGTLVVEFADRIAWRKEPAPLSLVLVTTRVAARAESIALSKIRRVPAARIKWVNRRVFMVCLCPFGFPVVPGKSAEWSGIDSHSLHFACQATNQA